MELVCSSTRSVQLLSELLFMGDDIGDHFKQRRIAKPREKVSNRIAELVRGLTSRDLEELQSLAIANHVILRTFERLVPILEELRTREEADRVTLAIDEERKRIDHAVTFLHQICVALESSGCPVTVIKSLDHWPDLGSDLDLYTDADPRHLVAVMRVQFEAKVDARSWGDRLANKWNFIIPGLPELVEIHVGRLGQTGEQTAVTRSLSGRSRMQDFGGYTFRVAAVEDRIVISTLQRMYRHFYIRLCDVADNARLLDTRVVDFEYLHFLGSEAGLWDGIATYLRIISDYVETYRGYGTPLSSLVTGSAKFGAEKVQFRKKFLRVPILPQSLNLYAGELRTLLLRGDLRNSLRLSLLPGLATAAAVELKLTGSDKGIW